MDSLLDVKKRTRSLIGDPDGDFATDPYLLPLVNQTYDVATHRLLNTCSPFIEQYVVLPGVAQGTTSLQNFQDKGQPLFALVNPLEIEFKRAGAPDVAYRYSHPKRLLPHVAIGAPVIGVGPQAGPQWTWRGYVLTFTPLPFACDLRILGEFKPAALVKDTDLVVIHPMMTAALAFGTAALIGAERQNQNYVQSYAPQAEALLDDISNELVRQEGGTTARLGRANSSRKGPRGGYSF